MADVKEVEDSIRDIINWVKVWNLEEVEGGNKKIEDSVVDELKEKLEALAQKVGTLS